MAISVSCQCGKQFKVKDDLAGKAIRCPTCKSPVRVPGGKATVGASAGKSSTPVVDEKAALLKYEEAQKRKQLSAEEEAAYRAEQNKLVESYDQLSGRKGKEGEAKKGRPTEMKPKKPTIFTKIADLFGVATGTFIFKYIFIAVLLGGGAVGSVFLVKYVTGYMHEETNTQLPVEERVKQAMKAAEEQVAAGKWEEAKESLDTVIRLDKRKEIHRDYRRMRDQVTKALAKPAPK